jgi:glycosyltransferase involved in cell wall biosynthesis
MAKSKVALCLLVRNEEECLRILLSPILKYLSSIEFSNVYAIDGGSTDQTVNLLSLNKIPVIAQSQRGRGHAFREAFAKIDAAAIIFFSPDGNENIEDVPKFLKFLDKGYDLVIASRMQRGAVNEEDQQVFKWRKWANKTFNLIANICFRRSGDFVTDSINGYRAITKAAFFSLNLSALDYTIEYQMTIRALKHQLKIAEFPTHEGPRVAGLTGAPSIPTGLKFSKLLWSELTND